MEDNPGAGRPGSSDNLDWTLVTVFDMVALVLAGVVVIRGIGGILSALGVPALHLNLGAVSGSGLSVRSTDLLPTVIRLQYGTAWADVTSGLLLLIALGLLAVPRMVWDVPSEERRAVAATKLVVGVLVVAAAATIGAIVGIVNLIWHSDMVSPSTASLEIAGDVAAIALCALTCGLAWFALPLIRPTSTGERTHDDELTKPG